MSELYTKYATEQYVDNNLNIGLETKADAEHNHDSSYDIKGAANTALNSAKEYVDEAVSSLDTIIATDENSDGNIVLRPYVPEEDFIQVDKTLTIEGAAADAKAVGDRIKNLTTSGDAPVLDAVLGADGIMTYNNSPAFNEWLTEDEGSERFAPSGLVSHIIEDPSSDADLDAQLKAIFDGMPTDTVAYCAMKSAHATTSFGGGRVTFEIFKQTGGYGLIKAVKYWQGTQVLEQQRLVFNNVWHSWDWVNPPMALGGEYRTTERFQGKVVYTQYFKVGTAVNGASVRKPSGASAIIRHQSYIGSLPLPLGHKYIERSGYFAYTTSRTDDGFYLITDTLSDGYGSGGYNWYEQVWYVK